MLSPDRLRDGDLGTLSFVRRQESKGLRLLGGLTGVLSSASLLVDRVTRRVEGGEAGANLGASGVDARSFLGTDGVAGQATSSSFSSTSVTASSSSICSSVFTFWKRRQGLMEARVKGRLRWTSGSSSAVRSSSKSSVSCSDHLRKNLFPRLSKLALCLSVMLSLVENLQCVHHTILTVGELIHSLYAFSRNLDLALVLTFARCSTGRFTVERVF